MRGGRSTTIRPWRGSGSRARPDEQSGHRSSPGRAFHGRDVHDLWAGDRRWTRTRRAARGAHLPRRAVLPERSARAHRARAASSAARGHRDRPGRTPQRARGHTPRRAPAPRPAGAAVPGPAGGAAERGARRAPLDRGRCRARPLRSCARRAERCRGGGAGAPPRDGGGALASAPVRAAARPCAASTRRTSSASAGGAGRVGGLRPCSCRPGAAGAPTPAHRAGAAPPVHRQPGAAGRRRAHPVRTALAHAGDHRSRPRAQERAAQLAASSFSLRGRASRMPARPLATRSHRSSNACSTPARRVLGAPRRRDASGARDAALVALCRGG